MKLPYFPLYVGDFTLSTGELTHAEVGAYLRLLMYQWKLKSLPKSLDRLPIECVNEWPMIEQYFPVCEDGRRRNQRLEEERLKIATLREKQSQGGKMSAEKAKSLSRSAPKIPPNIAESESESESEIDSKEGSKSVANQKTGTQPKPYKIRVSEYFKSIDQEQRKIWAEAYPNVDLDTEFRKAKAWLLSNTNKAKKDFRRFLNNWLSRAMETTKSSGSYSSRSEIPDHILAGSAAERQWFIDHGIGESGKIEISSD